MRTQAKASHNPNEQASKNLAHAQASEIRVQACRLIKCLGLVPSYRNLYIVQLAIESESNFSSISMREAADVIIEGAQAARTLLRTVDYFWFEDSGWRYFKLSYKERDDWNMRRKMAFGT